MKYLFSLLLLLACGACAAQSAYFDALTLSKYARVHDDKLYIAIGNYQSPEESHNKDIMKTLITAIGQTSSPAIKVTLQDSAHQLQKRNIAILQSQRNELFTILKKYYPALQPGDITLDTRNPFFIVDSTGLRAQSTASLADLSGAVSAVGGLDVTTIANGIAKFLIKRGKQEMSIAFFQRFKVVIVGNADLRSLFPTTYPLLDAINAEIYNYSAYIQNLREAFKSDITALPKNLPALVDNHPDIFRKHPQLEVELVGACYLASELENHSHPGDILANFPPDLLDKLNPLTDPDSYPLKAGIQTLQLFSDALRNTADNGNTYWVSPDQLKTLTRDKISFRLFLGLTDQNAKLYYNGIPFTPDGTKTLSSYLQAAGSMTNTSLLLLDSYKTYLTTFTGQADELGKLIRDDRALPADSAAAEKYAIYFKAVVRLMEKTGDAGNLLCLADPGDLKPVTIYKALGVRDFHILLRPYFDVSYSLTDLVTAISGKNYPAAVNNAANVYKLVVVNGSKDVPGTADAKVRKEVNDAIDQLGKVSHKPVSATIKAEIMNNAVYANADFSEFVKYASFMAVVATAKTSDEVENAIEAAALPAGSYTIKQKSVFNISLNAYVGYGWDFSNIHLFKPGNLYANGIYAPIGFAASLGGKKSGAVTFFASLIDVGSLVSYNLGADSVKKLKQNIRLESIISPSLQCFYEIPGWPVALGAGWRRTPKVFFSNDSGFKVVDSKGVINLSVLIDIPLFTFYNRPRPY